MALPSHFSNLIDVLSWRAQHTPERIAYTFLNDGEQDEIHWMYGDLESRARAIAAELLAKSAGQRAVLLYPPGLEFIAAFLGCMYAGVTAVPLYPPRLNRSYLRLDRVLQDSQPAFALTTGQNLIRMGQFRESSASLKTLPLLATDNITLDAAQSWNRPGITSQSIALIQYTSGSTSSPKGVIVSHSNLWQNQQLIQQTFEQDENSIVVGWLPLYHDMGLIGNVLQPLFSGSRCILMSPQAFLQRPVRWLSSISRYHATTSGGPDFSYELCVRKVTDEEMTDLDLSSWRVSFSGAEPVRAETLDDFASKFSAVGFDRRSFRPCYGLAEATLLVSGCAGGGDPVTSFDPVALSKNTIRRSDAAGSKRLVACGDNLAGISVAIVDPELLQTCQPDTVGEIWVSGPSVAQGYWNLREETEATFGARLKGDGRTFLRTGDLGFVHEGRLFITGRQKDLIIIRGHNHYPQDLEATAGAAHPALRDGSSAAFSVEVAGKEQWVLVHESDTGPPETLSEAVDAARAALIEEHETGPYAVALIRRGAIPKTSSGKIQRSACRTAYLEGALKVVFEWRQNHLPTDQAANTVAILLCQTVKEVEDWLIHKIAVKTGTDPRDILNRRSIAECGIDSLASIELAYAIETELRIRFSPSDLLKADTIRQLADEIWHSQKNISENKPLEPVQNQQCPLTRGQESLWYLWQLAPESAAYNLAFAGRIPRAIDRDALRKVLQRLVARHGALRTVFHRAENALVQCVLSSPGDWLEEQDVETWSDEKLRARLEEEANRRFDLETCPLVRLLLFYRSTEAVLCLVGHHIIADFWSLALFVHEMTLGYVAETQGRQLGFPPSPTYSEYVLWQQNMLSGPEGERLYSYWSRQLAGELPILDFPTDRLRPVVQTFAGASRSFNLDPELSGRIKERSKRSGVTPYMTLLAALQVLLCRYTGQSEVLIGSPVACRTETKWAGIFGCFVNSVVLRADLPGNPACLSVLRQVREVVLGAFEHQHYPFSLLVERLKVDRDPGRSPLFQVMFAFEKTLLLEGAGISAMALGKEGKRLNLNGLPLEAIALKQKASLFDMMLVVAEIDGSFHCSLQYNSDLFDDSTSERVTWHWHELLLGMMADLKTPVAHLTMLSSKELLQILHEWNSTTVDLPSFRNLAELFEQQVIRTPESIALEWKDQRISYDELNQQSNLLARVLRRMGVADETLVGVCLRRRPEMVMALLGILKAGGAYVPLDPSYPPDRLKFMLADAGPRVLVTESDLATMFTGNAPESLCLDREWESLPGGTDENPERESDGRNLAYLIYTSGSSGRPKAVMITHDSAIALCHWANAVYSPQDLDGVLASTSICFDLSIFEIFVPLSRGGRIVLVNDVLEVPEMLKTAKVALINTVPSAMSELLRLGCVHASTINLAGEALTAELVQQLYAVPAVTKVYNLYGPSEDTTYSTYGQMMAEITPTIGRPIFNTRVYILDRYCEPVPLGAVGEIYIGGSGLARGYWRSPGPTAEKFLPDPFSQAGGERLYRTGDLGCYRSNGEICFLGRSDYQVKVRGYRIELGEIETVLKSCPGVADAVVVLAGGENQLLVGYVVTETSGINLAIKEIRKHLRATLPGYMVPSSVIQLEAMPRTANGKLDRKALPLLQAQIFSEVQAPQNDTQVALAEIWADVLKIKQVGIQDTFFDLGGHSLLATQVMARVRDRFQKEVPLRVFLEKPTIESLAASIDGMAADKDISYPLIPIRPRAKAARMELSYAQQRMWFLHQFEPNSGRYNLPATLHLEGSLNVEALENSLNMLLHRHEVLRTVFVAAAEGKPEQVVIPECKIALPLLTIRDGDRARTLQALRRYESEAAATPFDLSCAPLLRTLLLRLDEHEHALLAMTHHIASDGWSQSVMMKELGVLYSAFARGEAPVLPDLLFQYGDYVAWEREWLQTDEAREHLNYWKKQLAGISGNLDLPTDNPRPAVPLHRGASRNIGLVGDLARRLEQIGKQNNATLFMVLLAAFQILLWKYCGQTEIVVGTPIAGRTRTETERLIGLFVNTLVMRVEIDSIRGFAGLLDQVRETALAAYAHQDLPFEKIVEELHPDRHPGHSPLFQVVFAYQNIPKTELQLHNLKVTMTELESATSKFDLTFFVQDGDDDLTCRIEYDSDLFHASTIDRMLQRWERLLQLAVMDPHRPLADLSLLMPAEAEQIVEKWNGRSSDYSRQSLGQLVSERAAAQPGAAAVIFQDSVLTYSDLNRRSNQLARYLMKKGVRKEELVGICMSRNTQVIVAMVAVLKAGAAYVPLDIAYPEDRLKYMLEDSGVRLLLVQDSLPVFSSLKDVLQVCFDQEWQEIALLSDEDMAPLSTAESLAYVMYTSGSTGTPKGVAVTHRNIARLVLKTDYIGFGSDEVFLQFAPLSFDAATFEIWGPLLNGATLVVFTGHPSLLELGRYLKQYKITTLWLTAGLFHLMIGEQIDDLREVGQLIAGGDVLQPDIVKKAVRELPLCHLVNGYGPTEGTTFSCCYVVNPEVEGLKTVPIGKAICNSTAYVFDEGMNLAPVGMAGELLIGGDGLARGYWNHPVMTAERFIPDPFSRVPGGRLYRSGDLARYRIDGDIEFLGRMDRQVKIRGFRVDLREIESALISHGDVKEAVVIARKSRRGDQEVVAYLVAQDPESEFVTDKIKEYLRNKLPAYMAPTSIMLIDRVPLTANGKLDRTALPVDQEADDVEYVAPATATERALAAIWQDLLHVEKPGIHDNFFNLGGHSLLALQVISRIRAAFRVEIPLRSLFEEPTIAGLTRNIELNILSENGRPQLVRVPREARMVRMAADEDSYCRRY